MRHVAALLLLLTATASPAARQALVIVREGAPHYHRPGCPLVREAKDVLAMTRAQAEARGLKSHPDCDPAVDPEAGRGGPPPNPEVFVGPGGKYYLRETCRRLEKPSRRVRLNEAARKHFPCRTCKPPIRPRK